MNRLNSPSAAVVAAVMIIASGFATAPDADAQTFQSPLQSSPLQSLPPMRAMPIASGGSSAALTPSALVSPPYCDSETLRQSATIRAIRFWDERLGIAVGDHGCILVTQDGGQTWTDSNSNLQCRISDAAWIDARRVVVVGGGLDGVTRISRGVVAASNDGGKTWHRSADSELPMLHSIARDTDDVNVRTTNRVTPLTAHGDSDPITGASTFRSNDGGRSWQASLGNIYNDPGDHAGFQSTVASASSSESEHWAKTIDTRTVIRATCPINQETIVCGGDHGNIFRSADSGRSWQTVHGEGAACAILVIAGSSNEIPWALAGRETLEKRHRTNLLLGTNATHPAIGLSQAAMQIGVAGVDVYPIADPAASIKSLTQWIDVHRPPIIALDANINTEVRTAILQHAVAVGTDKVVQYDRGTRGETLFHDSAMLPGCGVLAGDFRDDSMMLVGDCEMIAATQRKAPWIAIETRYGGGSQSTHGDSIGFGARLTPAHRLPQQETKASRRRLQVIQGRLKQQNAIADLFEKQNRTGQWRNTNAFADAMKLLLDQTSRIDQFRSAIEIARHAIGNQHQIAVWNEIADRFIGSSAANLAELHSKARENSLEWRQHPELSGPGEYDADHVNQSPTVGPIETFLPLTDASKELLPDPAGHAAIVSPFQSNETKTAQSQLGVVQASALLPIGRSRTQNYINRSRQSTQNEVDLAWQMHPMRLIVEDAIARNERRHLLEANDTTESGPEDSPTISLELPAADQEDKQQDDQYASGNLSADLRRIAERRTAWSEILKPHSPQTAVGVRTEAPPRLDGKLDEPFWNPAILNTAQSQTAQSQTAQTWGDVPITHQFAWDERFLYVAIQTPIAEFHRTENPDDIGVRDADLINSDRVTIGIDVDRDLLTAMNISFTRDGRTHDDIDGNSRWNPTWYVASNQSADHVTTEIAIELASLGVDVQPGDSWFVRTEVIPAGQPRRFEMMPDALSRVRVDFH